ncbi:MAG: DUF4215 domain-containing protein [Myxococcales bacterium]|nr:DUF4215 domain-containing protein [Myxococcales bacterium]
MIQRPPRSTLVPYTAVFRSEGVEACDDGNTVDGDGCDGNCTPTGCGNGVVTGEEACDDGNAVSGDGCDATCVISGCGNGVVAPDEACDDGNDVDGDGCDANCTVTGCGNGIQTMDEGCDDGNDVDGDGCDANCTVSGCGNGVVGPDEGCDDGNAISGDGCDANCTVTGCGNGVQTAGEACDDGNLDANDGCSPTCVIECGNGTLQPTEECDGDNFGGQSCVSLGQGYIGGDLACTTSCTLDTSGCVAPACGNGVVEVGEACDGVDLGGATCASIGQGYVGGTLGCDACAFDTSACVEAGCGNGILEAPGEQCDDGNLDAGDGCDGSCLIEGVLAEREPNDDGTPQPGGSGITGNDFDATAVSNALANGVIDATGGDVLVYGRIGPVGDEDVFAISNSTGGPVPVRFDVYNQALGVGVACGTSIDTGLQLRDAAGTSLAYNDDRAGANDRCSALTYVVPAGATVFAQLVEYGDDAEIPGYFLGVDFLIPVCGNGTVEPGEQCDDGGTVPGDGCGATCRVEGVVTEVEPNDTTAGADAAGVVVTGTSTLAGTITDVSDEVDQYRVEVATPTVVRVEAFTSLYDCDATTITVRLRDAAGVELASDGGAGIRSCGAIVTYLPAGTYYVGVEETGTNASIAQYFVQVAFQDDAGAEAEAAGASGANDAVATAEAGLVGASNAYVSGDHVLNADSDVYAITVPAGGRLRAEVIEGDRAAETCESNGIDARLTLFDEAGVQLVDDDDDGRGYCSLIDGTGAQPLDAAARNDGATARTYYLQVRASSFAQSGAAGQFVYRLQVTVR